jgi:hypothetical protein
LGDRNGWAWSWDHIHRQTLPISRSNFIIAIIIGIYISILKPEQWKKGPIERRKMGPPKYYTYMQDENSRVRNMRNIMPTKRITVYHF